MALAIWLVLLCHLACLSWALPGHVPRGTEPPTRMTHAWFESATVLGDFSGATPRATTVHVTFDSPVHLESAPAPSDNVDAAPGHDDEEDWAVFHASLHTLRFAVSHDKAPARLTRCRVLLPASQALTDAAGAPLLPMSAQPHGSAWAAASPPLAAGAPASAPDSALTRPDAARAYTRARHLEVPAPAPVSPAGAAKPAPGSAGAAAAAAAVAAALSGQSVSSSAPAHPHHDADAAGADAGVPLEAQFLEEALLGPVFLELAASLHSPAAREAARVAAAAAAAEVGPDPTADAEADVGSVFLELSAHATQQESSFVMEARARARATAAAAAKLDTAAEQKKQHRRSGAGAGAGAGDTAAGDASGAGDTLYGIPLSASIADATVMLQTGATAHAQVMTMAAAAQALQARHLVRHAQRLASESESFLRLANQLESAVRAKAVVSHGVVWQTVARPMMVMSSDFIRQSMQELMYQGVKATALPAVECLLCEGKALAPEGTDPDLPSPEDLINPRTVQQAALDESDLSGQPDPLKGAMKKFIELEATVTPTAASVGTAAPAAATPAAAPAAATAAATTAAAGETDELMVGGIFLNSFIEVRADTTASVSSSSAAAAAGAAGAAKPTPKPAPAPVPALNASAPAAAAGLATASAQSSAEPPLTGAPLATNLSPAALEQALSEIESSERAQRLIAAVRTGRAEAENELRGIVATHLAEFEARSKAETDALEASVNVAKLAGGNAAALAAYTKRVGTRPTRAAPPPGTHPNAAGARELSEQLLGVTSNAFDHIAKKDAEAKRSALRAEALAAEQRWLAEGAKRNESEFYVDQDADDAEGDEDAADADKPVRRQFRTPAAVAEAAAALMDREAQRQHFAAQQHALQSEYARTAGARYSSLAETGAQVTGTEGYSPKPKETNSGAAQVADAYEEDDQTGLAGDIVKWIVDPLVANLEPAVLSAVQDASIQTIAYDVDERLRESLNGTLVRDVTRGTVTLMVNRLTYSFTHRITRGLVRRMIPEVTHLTTGPLMSALSHSLSMTLTRSLTRNPKHDEDCWKCGPDPGTKNGMKPVSDANKACNVCKIAEWNEYYLDYYAQYYTQYFYGYYGYYYGDYFSRVFAEEQLLIMEEAQLLVGAQLANAGK